MRVPITYYLVLLYVTVMFKPLLPNVSDALAHTFSEAIHIATVHAMYGSNHLEKELSNTLPDNAGSRHSGNINTEEPVPVHVPIKECMYVIYFTRKGKDHTSLKLYTLKPGFFVKNFPPPKFCC